jgi:predicted metalloprotease with PDZ domain
MLGTPVLPSLYAHEIFHAWNVKRLRPSEMWPYRYDGEQPTPLLWISEGITDYYADLAEVRGGIIDPKGFYMATGDKMSEVEELPPTGLEDASLSTWIHPRDGSGYIYYPKGSLAGLLLDIMIRDGSDNHGSLDDVMRTLYNAAYKNGRGFTSDEWWSTVSKTARGKSFTDFYARFIDGREPFPYDKVLPLAGLRLLRDTTHVPQLGIASLQDSTGLHVTQVVPGSAAAAAGVQPGDQLISVGGFGADDPEWTQKFRARFARMPEGTDLAVVIRRAGSEQTLTAHLHFVTSVGLRLVEDPRPSARERRIREGLLRGVTQP